ncbi:MAG: hypothetical protein ACF8PN_08035 [Phycisphaerales bacterium]
MSDQREMVTYQNADGSCIYGEYLHVTSTDWFDEDTEPTPFMVRRRWVLVEEEHGRYWPAHSDTLCTLCLGEGAVIPPYAAMPYNMLDPDDPTVTVTCPRCGGMGDEPHPREGWVTEEPTGDR